MCTKNMRAFCHCISIQCYRGTMTKCNMANNRFIFQHKMDVILCENNLHLKLHIIMHCALASFFNEHLMKKGMFFIGPPNSSQKVLNSLQSDAGSAAWLSGRTSVSGRRTFPVLHSTYSWWVTTYVGNLSAIDQSTRPTQPFITLGSINEE